MTQALTFPKMDLKSITLLPQAVAQVVRARKEDGFYLNERHSDDFRLRVEIYDRLKKAQERLPQGLAFMVYEAYRPLSRQTAMWAAVQTEMREKQPHLPPEEFEALCETFIANPYDGIGSGHQAGCAIDITLCTQTGVELDMGAPMHGFTALAWTESKNIPEYAIGNRKILKETLESEGFLNYPAEWWHYSYGDHGWAWLAGKKEALYGPLDLPERRIEP